jgi:Sec-independent protein secretion pathway component TatC
MVLDGTPFLGPVFLWAATTIGGLVVALLFSVGAKTEREKKDWTYAFLTFFVLAMVLSPFGGIVHP